MLRTLRHFGVALGALFAMSVGAPAENAWAPEKQAGAVRVATFNVWDLRAPTGQGCSPTARLQRLASVLEALSPDIVLLNEVAYSASHGSPDASGADGALPYLLRALPSGAEYEVFTAPVNTGVPSGFDLNNDGAIVAAPGSRGYGEDCFGYGEFPGQYGMALLVRSEIGAIDRDGVRTFQRLLWRDMPGAMLPPRRVDEAGRATGSWYSDGALGAMRLSSKSHWDVPVRLRDGGVVHILASHPTPPSFDGPEDRNGRRNHDEVRFWADYLTGGEAASYIVDDRGASGGLGAEARFVLLGDLNADPEKGSGRREAVVSLLSHDRVNGVAAAAHGARSVIAHRPDSAALQRPIGPTDTAMFGLRVDYALPSRSLVAVRAGMIRDEPPESREYAREDLASRAGSPWWLAMFPSDHFPVYVDVLPFSDARKD